MELVRCQTARRQSGNKGAGYWHRLNPETGLDRLPDNPLARISQAADGAFRLRKLLDVNAL